VNWYLEALKKYAQFKGRSQRKEYWWFITVDSVLSTLLAVVDVALSGAPGLAGQVAGPLGIGYSVAMLIPRAAVVTRRFHDTGRGGWWGLKWLVVGLCLGLVVMVLPSLGEMGPAAVVVVPLVGIAFITWIFSPLIVLMLGSQVGDNRYGPNPTSAVAQAVEDWQPDEPTERDDEPNRGGPTRWS
jgi:uncharacterized membrane protein YhaH (DUF805 family)